MAVGVIIRLPEGVGAEAYDATTSELNLEGNPAEGLIFHCAGELEGRFQVFDVWESFDQFERFAEERLKPAQIAVMGEEAFAAAPDPEIVQTQIHNHVAF